MIDLEKYKRESHLQAIAVMVELFLWCVGMFVLFLMCYGLVSLFF